MADDDVRVPAGWYPDPLGLPQLRWWDNHAWTEHTSDARQPMVAQESPAQASRPTTRLGFADPFEDEAAIDDVYASATRAATETDDAADRLFGGADLGFAEPALSIEAPARDHVAADPSSPAHRLAAGRVPAGAPTSRAYNLDTRFEDLLGQSSTPRTATSHLGDQETTYIPDAAGYGRHAGAAGSRSANGRVGTDGHGTDRYGTDRYGTDGYSTDGYGTDGYGADGYGADGYGADRYGADRFGTAGAAYGDADDRWADPGRRSRSRVAVDDAPEHVSTGPVWAIALMPLAVLVLGLLFLLSGLAGPASAAFLAIVVVVPYLLTVALAVLDARSLEQHGFDRPPHWAWAFATAPVYLAMRMARVVRETGRGFGPLMTWGSLAALVGASVIAVPGLVLALAPATFANEAEESVRADADALGGDIQVDCPELPPLLVSQSFDCAASNARGQEFTVIVSLQRANGWIDWRVDDWGIRTM